MAYLHDLMGNSVSFMSLTNILRSFSCIVDDLQAGVLILPGIASDVLGVVKAVRQLNPLVVPLASITSDCDAFAGRSGDV